MISERIYLAWPARPALNDIFLSPIFLLEAGSTEKWGTEKYSPQAEWLT